MSDQKVSVDEKLTSISEEIISSDKNIVCTVEHRVVGHDTCRTIRDKELIIGDAGTMQALQLLDE